MTTTLRTVARECGVDVSTVSRALRGDARVSPDTAQRVQAAAQRLGYRPNLAARSLQAGATRTVWCLVDSLEAVNERRLAAEASRVIEAAGYDLLIATHRSDADAYGRLFGRIDQGLADAALIVPGSRGLGDEAALRTLVRRRYPLVFLDRSSGRAGDPTVTTDNAGAAGALVQRLAAAGIRRLAVLEEDANDVAVARREAAIAAATALGLPCRRMPDGAWLAAGDGSLGILSTGQGRIHHFCAGHAEALRGIELRFAVFDEWTGEPHPARSVFVAVQDFPGMARRAAERVLAAVADRAAWTPATDRLPLLRIDSVTATF